MLDGGRVPGGKQVHQDTPGKLWWQFWRTAS
jgi:hypothetical protein